MDLDVLWHTLGNGALIAAALTLARLGVEFLARRADRAGDREDRRLARQHDADARLERLLEDRLASAERRAERLAAELDAERVRRAAAERDYAALAQAYLALYASLSPSTRALGPRRATRRGEHGSGDRPTDHVA